MAKRNSFSIDKIFSYVRNISNDVSECEDSGSECGNLNNPDQDSDSSISNESEPDLSALPDLSNRFFKQPRIQNELETTKTPQKIK